MDITMSDKQRSIFDVISDIFSGEKKEALSSDSWTINIDGASRGNPGPSGAGVYIQKNGKAHAGHGFFLNTKTNNEAEYLALVLAIFLLKTLIKPHDVICIRSDSELLIRQITGLYKVKKNELRQLYMVAQQESESMNITYEHVMREKNTHADALANEGVDKKKSLPIKFLDMLQRHEIFL